MMQVIDRPAHRNGYGVDRRGFVVDTVVLHTTEGTAGSALIWFADPRAHVAAHFVIAPDGRTYRCVPEDVPAYHAGHWGTNLKAIGVEAAGYHDRLDTWTPALVESLVQLLVELCLRFPGIKPDRAHIIGHNEVPDGKGGFGGVGHHEDPGALVPWEYLIGETQRRLAPPAVQENAS
jgi:N-acetyl-anhydromuramyl-L-alanine amidase AmpD